MIDLHTITQRRAAEQIVATWDDATLSDEIAVLNARLYRSTGIAAGDAAKLIHAERFKRQRGGA